jgi:hypothetical protein
MPRLALLQALRELRSQERSIRKRIQAVEKAIAALDRKDESGSMRGRRGPMSKAERKAVSLRMTRYWAARRRANSTS